MRYRGFESLPLRQIQTAPRGRFLFGEVEVWTTPPGFDQRAPLAQDARRAVPNAERDEGVAEATRRLSNPSRSAKRVLFANGLLVTKPSASTPAVCHSCRVNRAVAHRQESVPKSITRRGAEIIEGFLDGRAKQNRRLRATLSARIPA